MDNNQPDIDQILKSLDNVNRASPGPFFLSKLENRLANQKRQEAQPIQDQWLTWILNHQYLVAAGIILLLMLNIVVFANINTGVNIYNDDTTTSLVEDYNLNGYAWYSYNE